MMRLDSLSKLAQRNCIPMGGVKTEHTPLYMTEPNNPKNVPMEATEPAELNLKFLVPTYRFVNVCG